MKIIELFKKYILGQRREVIFKSTQGAKAFVESQNPESTSEAKSLFRAYWSEPFELTPVTKEAKEHKDKIEEKKGKPKK